MIKRMVLMLVVTTAAITTLGFVKFRQFQAAGQGSYQPPPEAVTTIQARAVNWPEVLNLVGTAAAVKGVTVSADLPGIVDDVAFESGKFVPEGDVLVELDTREEQAQLVSAESARDLARLNFNRLEGLVEEGAISRAEYDRASAERKQADAAVGAIRATIERKTVRAPFSGVLGIRQVNLGQYLASGNPIVTLQSMDPIYVNFGVPQQQADDVQIGRAVRVTAGEGRVHLTGEITAMESVVDTATRNVTVQATLANPDAVLRPGMFVEAEVPVGASRSVVAIPASSINYAPYGDSVFIVSGLKDPNGKVYRGVHQRFVKLGGMRGDQIAVVSGVKAGEEVVTSGVFKLRNGAAVVVNNKVRPGNNPAPKPEES
jgi:membrane fusion protein, multidrug efflux system